MPSHWTYYGVEPESDLEQGDFLVATASLRDVLRRVHPHFTDPKYLGFLVLTQSCDLVRRGRRPPAASYINIAVVRPFRAVLPRLISTVAAQIAPGVFKAGGKEAARQLVERIVDQNEQKLGLFYLHDDSDLELGEPAVCFLRVGVALRAEHYDLLVQSRRGRLLPEFGNKLGWLTGNLYSRVAALDWADKDAPQAKALVTDYVTPKDGSPHWFDDSVIEEAQTKEALVPSMSTEDALSALQHFQVKKPLDLAVAAIMRTVSKVLEESDLNIDAAVSQKLQNKLANNGDLKRQLRKPPS